MDTAFAKIVSDMDGRDHILIEGRVVSLLCSSTNANNEMVDTIVRGLRRASNEPSGLVGLARNAHPTDAANLGVQTIAG